MDQLKFRLLSGYSGSSDKCQYNSKIYKSSLNKENYYVKMSWTIHNHHYRALISSVDFDEGYINYTS